MYTRNVRLFSYPKECGMHRRPLIATILFISLLMWVLACGCSQRRYTTTFTPQSRQTPETLDMNYQGPRATIAVGDFSVKARGATSHIGDGLREMLESALFESLRFNVLDRLDPQGLKAEQQLSYSKMARRDARKLGAQMDVAELMFYGTVTEFEAEASGVGVDAAAPSVPVKASASGKNAHMAIDVRVVDVASGRLVAARRIAGSAAAYKASAGTVFGSSEGPIPVSLGSFANTPMELAIRDCIYRSVIYACHALPQDYFRH
jgi:curli biogenesis system outer membrane secretion channel CsgG